MWLKKRLRPDESEPAKRILKRRHTPLVQPDINFSLTGEDFQRNGSALPKFASHAVRTAIQQIGRPHGNHVIKVGSFCTGSSADAIAMEALQRAFKDEAINVEFEHMFYCEKHDRKRDVWCKRVHQIISDTTVAAYLPCAFHDCEVLGTNKAKCTMHRKQGDGCSLPQHLGLLVAGFSCKDFSRANTTKGALQGADIFNAKQTPGGSAQTMHAVLNLLSSIKVDAILLENSDELAGPVHSPALDEFLNALSEKRFDCHCFVMNASDYSLPQERKRAYILGVARPNSTFAIQEGHAFFSTVKCILKACATQAPSFPSCLLPADDTAVQKFLQHRQTNGTLKGWESKTINSHREKWLRDTGMRWGTVEASAADVASPWFSTLAAREKDLLAFHQYKTRSKDDLAKGRRLITDLHQSMDQFTWGHVSETGRIYEPTILPAAKLWVSSEARCIHRMQTGAESLNFQGWPILEPRFSDLLENESNAFHQDLAGNAFPTTCVLACILSLIFAGNFRDEGEGNEAAVTDTDIQAAMSLMQRAQNA